MIRLKHASILAGISIEQLRKDIREGKLESYFFGSLYKVTGEDLARYIARRKYHQEWNKMIR